jgi:hypothetical protein
MEFIKITGTPRQRAAIASVLASVAGTESYGLALAAGEARWSGSDLKGKAREWGARYAARRAAIMGELARRGVAVDRKGAVLHLSAATHRVTVASGALAGMTAFAVARGPDYVLAGGRGVRDQPGSRRLVPGVRARFRGTRRSAGLILHATPRPPGRRGRGHAAPRVGARGGFHGAGD